MLLHTKNKSISLSLKKTPFNLVLQTIFLSFFPKLFPYPDIPCPEIFGYVKGKKIIEKVKQFISPFCFIKIDYGLFNKKVSNNIITLMFQQ